APHGPPPPRGRHPLRHRRHRRGASPREMTVRLFGGSLILSLGVHGALLAAIALVPRPAGQKPAVYVPVRLEVRTAPPAVAQHPIPHPQEARSVPAPAVAHPLPRPRARVRPEPRRSPAPRPAPTRPAP